MKKLWMALAAGIILTMGGLINAEAEEFDKSVADKPENGRETEAGWFWREDSIGWRYEKAEGEFKKNCWMEIDGNWYYFDHDGYMASDWMRIRGIDYCFHETGELAAGWCFDEEEEKWHYFNEDGTAQTGWFKTGDGLWYWFSTKGEMVSSGYKNIEGKRYYFLENGQLAANKYVGLSYMDDNGQRNRDFDIVIEGKKSSASVSGEVKEAFTEAAKNIPGQWVKKFNEDGWQILYYPDKEFFSAPLTGSGTYFVSHKLDSTYRKIKICKPEALTEVFGEYIGYASGLYEDSSQDGRDLSMSKGILEDFVYVPDYYEDDMKFYFGKLVEAYLSNDATRSEIEETAPEAADILKRVLYGKG